MCRIEQKSKTERVSEKCRQKTLHNGGKYKSQWLNLPSSFLIRKFKSTVESSKLKCLRKL